MNIIFHLTVLQLSRPPIKSLPDKDDSDDKSYDPIYNSEISSNSSQPSSDEDEAEKSNQDIAEGTVVDFENNANSARKRKKKADKNEWMRNKNKLLRMSGEEYLGFSKNRGQKIKQNTPRRARALKGA